jgi:hypothetical protein
MGFRLVHIHQMLVSQGLVGQGLVSQGLFRDGHDAPLWTKS